MVLVHTEGNKRELQEKEIIQIIDNGEHHTLEGLERMMTTLDDDSLSEQFYQFTKPYCQERIHVKYQDADDGTWKTFEMLEDLNCDEAGWYPSPPQGNKSNLQTFGTLYIFTYNFTISIKWVHNNLSYPEYMQKA